MIPKRLLQLETKLFESLSNARKLYSSKITSGIFEELVSLDPSKTFKYIEKICKFYLEYKGINLEKLKSEIETFDSLSQKNLIDNRDINSFKNYTDFSSFISLNSNKMSKSEEKALIKNEGSEVILNTKDLLVLLIKDEKASIMYGSGTKWCIAATDSENYFKRYRKDRVTFYFIFQKNLPSSDPLYKIAIAVYPDLKMEMYNAKDRKFTSFKILKELGINKNIFKVNSLNKEELDEFLKNHVDGTWKINSKGEIDVDGDILMNYKKLISISDIGKFGKVTGDFVCTNNWLKDLEGCPRYVGGTFNVWGNVVKSLKFLPGYVGGDFNLASNHQSLRNPSAKEFISKNCEVKGRIIGNFED